MADFATLKEQWKNQAVPEKLPPELQGAYQWNVTAGPLSDMLFRSYQRNLEATRLMDEILGGLNDAVVAAQNDASAAKARLAKIAALGADAGTISNPPTQAEVTRIRDKLNTIIAAAV